MVRGVKSVMLSLFLGIIPQAQAATLSGIQTRCRVDIKDTGASRQRFSDAQLAAFINESQDDIAQDLWPIRKSFVFELVAGTTYYSMPSDWLHTTRTTRDHQAIEEKSLASLDKNSAWQSVGGLPTVYFVSFSSRTKVGFYPFPDTVSSTGTIRMEYIAKATYLAGSTDEPFGGVSELQPYADLLVHYCAYRAAMIYGQQDLAAVYLNAYQAGLKTMQKEINTRPSYNPPITPATR